MEVIYAPKAVKDLEYWKKSGHKGLLKKIQDLIAAIEFSPFEGIGKPEPLKHQLSGLWSRRIDKKHRIIYEIGIEDQKIKIITILSLKDHYFL